LNGFDRIFSGESPHEQRQLTIGRHPDRTPINPLHILRDANTTTIDSYQKLDDFHRFFSIGNNKDDNKMGGELMPPPRFCRQVTDV
jgi:hypothetical protein